MDGPSASHGRRKGWSYVGARTFSDVAGREVKIMRYRYREVDKILVDFFLNYWDRVALNPLRFWFFFLF